MVSCGWLAAQDCTGLVHVAEAAHSCTCAEISTGWPQTRASEEIGLLHDPQELLLIHFAVAITIGLVDHLLQLLVSHALAELLRHPLQILKGDLASLVVVEEPEGLEDLVFGVAVQDLVRHHL